MDTITRVVDLKNTVILNVYKRPEYLIEQVEAILSQTFPPDDIWIVVNKDQDYSIIVSEEVLNADRLIRSKLGKPPTVIRLNPNKKYHARFAIALLVDTYYVSFFDDDTIPGRRWFESCYNEDNKHPGIYGTAGVILNSPQYVHHERIGWPSMNEETTRVDLCGHAWFLRREYLQAMWVDPPASLENGEDIQLSFQLQKYAGVNTYCPPHPEDDKDRWGSLKGWEYGNDKKASSNGSLMSIPDFYSQRDYCIMYGLTKGWKTVKGIEKMFPQMT